jgi:hypothetical protein
VSLTRARRPVPIVASDAMRARFDSVAKEVMPTGCIEWQGRADQDGYATFYVSGSRRQVHAHRVAWVLSRGPIAEDLFVCHSCDNRLCVNVAHLWLGTAGDNARDAAAKGRIGHTRGTRHGNCKLCDDAVREIRARIAAGETRRSLAHEFEVSEVLVSFIASRQRRQHVV